MQFRVTHLFTLMTLVAALATIVVIFEFSDIGVILFGSWAVVFAFLLIGERKRD
jgi:hypothetical protein